MLLQGQDNAVGYDGGEDHVLKWSETVKKVTHDLNTYICSKVFWGKTTKKLCSLLIHAGFKYGSDYISSVMVIILIILCRGYVAYLLYVNYVPCRVIAIITESLGMAHMAL